MDELVTELRAQLEKYAQQRDQHLALANQFSGAVDALKVLLAKLENPPVPEASNGQ